MFIRPNIIRRFTHTHSKTIFPENNNKAIEDLIRHQNSSLENIKNSLYLISLHISLLTIVIVVKPMK